MLSRVKGMLARLHNDEQGAEGLEKLLIIAAIVLPLLGVLIFYRGDISDWVKSKWEEMRGKGLSYPDTATPFTP